MDSSTALRHAVMSVSVPGAPPRQDVLPPVLADPQLGLVDPQLVAECAYTVTELRLRGGFAHGGDALVPRA